MNRESQTAGRLGCRIANFPKMRDCADRTMASDQQVIRSEHGVVLSKATLRQGNFAVAEAYCVTSRRIPDAPSFDTLLAAEEYYRAEVALSALGRR